MTAPLFWEDSLGEKLAEKAGDAWASLASADDELVDDPAALAEALREVNAEDPEAIYAQVEADWVPVFGPSKLSGLLDVAGPSACVVTMPLAANDIEFAWQPYPPEEMPGACMPSSHAVDRPFTLFVAPENVARAHDLLTAIPGSAVHSGLTSTHELAPEARAARRTLAWTLFVVFLGVDALVFFGYIAYALYHLVRYHHF
jgi:hypothetical protein